MRQGGTCEARDQGLHRILDPASGAEQHADDGCARLLQHRLCALACPKYPPRIEQATAAPQHLAAQTKVDVPQDMPEKLLFTGIPALRLSEG